MKPDDEWAAWEGDFRAAPDLPPGAREVVARARRDQWKSRGELALECAAYLGGVGFFVAASARFPQLLPFASFVAPAFVVALAYTLHARWGTWRRSGHAVAAFVELEWKRKRADVRLLRFGRVLLGALTLGFAVWVPYLIASRQAPVERIWPIVVALAFSVATLAVTWLFLTYRLRAERRRLESLEQLRTALGLESG